VWFGKRAGALWRNLFGTAPSTQHMEDGRKVADEVLSADSFLTVEGSSVHPPTPHPGTRPPLQLRLGGDPESSSEGTTTEEEEEEDEDGVTRRHSMDDGDSPPSGAAGLFTPPISIVLSSSRGACSRSHCRFVVRPFRSLF
jgi:hypothetical protein